MFKKGTVVLIPMDEWYRGRYEANKADTNGLPSLPVHIPVTQPQVSAFPKEDLDDRILAAFVQLSDDEKWHIVALTERLARSSKMYHQMIEMAKEHG